MNPFKVDNSGYGVYKNSKREHILTQTETPQELLWDVVHMFHCLSQGRVLLHQESPDGTCSFPHPTRPCPRDDVKTCSVSASFVSGDLCNTYRGPQITEVEDRKQGCITSMIPSKALESDLPFFLLPLLT